MDYDKKVGEIISELERKIEYWISDSAAGWDRCEERRIENSALAHKLNRIQILSEKLVAALEKIADPRKRDHTEPDAYTQLGCVMNIANEALEEYNNE